MNKKALFIILTVVAFFAGQIFLEESLRAIGVTEKTFAMFLVPAFELAAGWVLGYFFRKSTEVKSVTKNTDSKVEPVQVEKKIATVKKTSTKKSNVKVS